MNMLKRRNSVEMDVVGPSGGGGGRREQSRWKRYLVVSPSIDEALSPLRDLGVGIGYLTTATTDCAIAMDVVMSSDEPALAVLLLLLAPGREQTDFQRVKSVADAARRRDRRTFIIVHSPLAASSAVFRAQIFASIQGLNMATASREDVNEVLQRIKGIGMDTGSYRCPSCGMENLTEDDMVVHFPLYHVNDKSSAIRCPICGKVCDPACGDPFAPHLFNSHGAHSRLGHPHEDEEGPSLYAYALVVCRNDKGQLLLVQEFSGCGFWLPGGRVDPGEDFAKAAIRELEEEAGVTVELTGVLRVEFSPEKKKSRRPYCRMRVIFMGKPRDPEQMPKSVPDYESVGAAWASLEDIQGSLPLRGQEPLVWATYLANGGPVYPLSVLTREGAKPPSVSLAAPSALPTEGT